MALYVYLQQWPAIQLLHVPLTLADVAPHHSHTHVGGHSAHACHGRSLSSHKAGQHTLKVHRLQAVPCKEPVLQEMASYLSPVDQHARLDTSHLTLTPGLPQAMPPAQQQAPRPVLIDTHTTPIPSPAYLSCGLSCLSEGTACK